MGDYYEHADTRYDCYDADPTVTAAAATKTMIAKCERCNRKMVPGVPSLAGTRAIRDGEVIALDGRTCRICLARDGWAPYVTEAEVAS